MNTIRTLVAFALVALAQVALVTPVATADSALHGCKHGEVINFWESYITGNEASGKAVVCTGSDNVFARVQVKNLTPGNAYTIWWAYIDDPASCADFPLPSPDVIPFPEPDDYAGACGFADFFTVDPSGEFINPLAAVGRMDGVVAKSSRRTLFSGRLRSFTPRSGSQLWYLVFGHGPADKTDNRQRARQLLTPEDPGSGAPHLGIEGRPYGYPAAVVVFDID